MKSYYEYFLKVVRNRENETFRTVRNRKSNFYISPKRLNVLFDRYFTGLDINQDQFQFVVIPEDFDEITYLLRVHFRIWIDINGFHITLYKDFPRTFKLVAEVNTNNHWFTPKTFPTGTTLYYGTDPYSVCNRLKGIPLSKEPYSNDKNGIRPIVQINYDFIEAY